MLSMSASLKKRAKKLKTFVVFVPSNVWFLRVRVRLRFLIWALTSAVARDDRVSVVIVRWYDRYDMILSNLLFVGLINRKPECGGLVCPE